MPPNIHILLPLAGTLLGLGLSLAMVRIGSLPMAGYSRRTYRAIEVMDLKTGLLLTLVALLLGVSVALVTKLLMPQEQPSDVIGIPVDTYRGPIVLPPPPPINPDAANNYADLSALTKTPTLGVPRPVPDAMAVPEDDITTNDAVNLYGVQNATPDSIIAKAARDDPDGIPSPDDFIPYDRQPQAIVLARPVYPDICVKGGVEGTVTVQLLLNKRGQVADVRILKSSGNSFLDEAAKNAASSSRFTPAMQGDSPVSVWISLPFTFRLAAR